MKNLLEKHVQIFALRARSNQTIAVIAHPDLFIYLFIWSMLNFIDCHHKVLPKVDRHILCILRSRQGTRRYIQEPLGKAPDPGR